MNNSVVNKLIKLNKDFYKNTAKNKSFSGTRNFSWIGWGRLAKTIGQDSKTKIKRVLDLGCGNGRFYKELLTNLVWKNLLADDFEYIGLDIDELMLKESQERYSNGNAKFYSFDIISNYKEINNIYGKFDLVVGFGVTHHIPSALIRKEWFASLSSIVNVNGYVCITTWCFLKSKQFKLKKNEINLPNISIDKHDLEKGDYFLGWDKEKDLYRYCHHYDNVELSDIEDVLRRSGVHVIESFNSDGKLNNLNHYLIFKKLY